LLYLIIVQIIIATGTGQVDHSYGQFSESLGAD
jgi:hypothetical protein